VFQEINEAVSAVTHNASEIAAACREQSTGIQEVNRAVVAMNQLVQTSTAMIGQSTTVAEGLRREAQSLASLVSRFNVGEGEVPDTRLGKLANAPPAKPSRRERRPAPTLGRASDPSEAELAQAVVRGFFEAIEPPTDRTKRRD
jgi:methyl-accepting chemotaxis protein